MSSQPSSVDLTIARVQEILKRNPAFAQVERGFYVIRQGSAYVYVQVVAWPPDRAIVRLVAQLARGVQMTPELAMRLLTLNARMRFGAFGFVKEDSCVVLCHNLLGGNTFDADEFMTALRQLALVADEYDDRIVGEAGGKRMQDLLDDAAAAGIKRETLSPEPWET